jgi:hypothetical protein
MGSLAARFPSRLKIDSNEKPNGLFPTDLGTTSQLTVLNSPFGKTYKQASYPYAPELLTDALRSIQYHIQHLIRFGEHRNVTAL